MSDNAIAAEVKAPDTMSTLSSILGIQQRKQAMLLQGQELERSQLETQQQQGVNQFFSNWSPGEHHGDDGTVDVDAARASPSYQALPGNARIAVDSKLSGLKSQQLQYKQQLVNLNSDAVKGLAQTAQAAAQDPDQGPALFDAYAKQGPDNARAAAIYGPLAAKAKYDPAALKTIAAQAQDIAGQQGQTNPAPTTYDTGKQILPATINKATGRPTLTGQAINRELGPTDQPEYKGAVAAATTRASGVGGSDIDRANAVSGGIGPAKNAIGITSRIDDLADQIKSGHFAKWVTEKAASAGVNDPAIVARQLLDKDLGQVKTLAASGASSDQKMQTILSGYPESTSATDTIHGAMDYIRGSFRQNLARGQQLNNYREKHPDLTGFQHADDLLTGNTDPLMHEYKALKTPDERIGFYKRNFASPEKAKEFKNHVTGMDHVFGQ